jgi:O-antigen/teichoic acid export membrane protein
VLAGRPEAAQPGWRAGLWDAGPLAVAGIAANGASLLVTLVLARVLAARDYGALNQLIGVFFVVSTPGSAVLVAVVRRVTRWPGSLDGVPRWGSEVHRRATGALVLVAAAILVAGSPIASLLGRPDPLGFDAAAVAGAVWVLLCVDRGLLQAHREYRVLSKNLLLEGAARTAFMISFGAAGLGVSGVASGVLVAELCTAAHARFVGDRAWRAEGGGAARTRRPARAAVAAALGSWLGAWRRSGPYGRDAVVRRDLVAALVALACVAVLQNIDVIVIGREAPRAAGAYAAVSVSSKALVFVAVAVAGYLLPEAAISWRAGRHALHQLLVTLAVLAAPALVLVTVAAAVPRPFLAAAFSGRYVSAAGAFLPLALAMVCLSVTVVVTMYLLGVGDRLFVAALVGAAALAAVAVLLAKGAPQATALYDLGVQGVLVCAAAGELARVHRARTRRSPRAPSSPRRPSSRPGHRSSAAGLARASRQVAPSDDGTHGGSEVTDRQAGGVPRGPVARRSPGSTLRAGDAPGGVGDPKHTTVAGRGGAGPAG